MLYQLREVGGFLIVIVLVRLPRHSPQDVEEVMEILLFGGLLEQSGGSGGEELDGPALELLLIVRGVPSPELPFSLGSAIIFGRLSKNTKVLL